MSHSHHHAERGCGCACKSGGCCSGKAKGRERMLGALRQTRVDRPPVWMMRQAGRHLPKYRALRETLSFLDLCRDEEANAIASAEPLQRYGLDAAIVFNDILTPLGDMGMKLDFQPGPRFERLIASAEDASTLTTPAYGPEADVSRCVRALRRTVGEQSAVLGFIGAPLTVAAFAIAGSGTQRIADLRTDAQDRRDVYVAMQERLLPVLTAYAAAQVAAGADVIQIFESLAYDIDETIYRQVGLPFLVRIIGEVRRVAPQTPVIAFGRGIWPYLVSTARAGATAVSVDETRPISDARRMLHEAGLGTALQGNLRPDVLLGTPEEATLAAQTLLRQWRSIVPRPELADTLGPTGWVFNLGHGVPAEANPDTVQAVVNAVKGFVRLEGDGPGGGVMIATRDSAENVSPSADLITKYGRPGPRYTSYPAVPYWPARYDPRSYQEALGALGDRARNDPNESVSLYVHVPFCEKRCLFCACNVVISRAHERGMAYVDLVRREMDMASRAMQGARPKVKQMHWGGGTPTWLSVEELRALYRCAAERFEMLPDREQSIEVDPRVTTPEHMVALRACGLNRISMGVQDIDPTVQDAISRHQTVVQTESIIRQARDLGIDGVTVDIVYGLPFQTVDSFRRTIQTVIDLGVDRVAVYNFAYLPERVKHQRVIRPEWLPPAEERVKLFQIAAQEFSAAGYDMIGMDHFAKRTDELSVARREGTMQRNFMGYTTRSGCDLLSFGVSAISRVGRDFAQNPKTTAEYTALIESGHSPVVHGMRLSDDDAMRESVIQSVMCYGEVDLDRVQREHGVDLLASETTRAGLRELEDDRLVTWAGRTLRVTPLGRYFVRNIAMTFDPYLAKAPEPERSSSGQTVQVKFSRTV